MKKTILFLIIMMVSMPAFCQYYKIGDLVTNPDGSQGIVFHLTPDGTSGYMIALHDASTGCTWGPTRDVPGLENVLFEDNYDYAALYAKSDGFNNTRILRETANANTFPAAWSVDFDNGWFLPSSLQLSMIFGALPLIEQPLAAAGGTTLDNDSYYWSSSEMDNVEAFCLDFGVNYNCGDRKAHEKTNMYRVRAIRNLDFASLPIIGQLMAPPALCGEGQLALLEPNVSFADAYGWEIDSDPLFSHPVAYEGQTMGTINNGWFLRFWASNEEGTTYSNVVKISAYPTFDEHIYATFCHDYQWGGVTYTEAGDYTRELVSSMGCDSIVTLHLALEQAEASEIQGEQYIFIEHTGDYTYSIDSVNEALGYEWSIDNSRWSLTTSPNSPVCTVHVGSVGNATLTIRVYTLCGMIERKIFINHSLQPDVVVYPNPTPTTAYLQLVGMEGETKIVICDAIGKIITSFSTIANITGSKVDLPLSNYAIGTYLIYVNNHHHEVVRKVVKE